MEKLELIDFVNIESCLEYCINNLESTLLVSLFSITLSKIKILKKERGF